VQVEEDVVNIVQDNTSTSTRHISSSTGQLSQSAEWHTVHANKLYPFHVQPVQGLQPENKICLHFLMGCGHPSISVLCVVD
jgi:hypothetical protein